MTERMADALQATAEIAGTTLSMPASRAMLRMLQPYGEDAVMDALHRCRRECAGRLTLADIFSRLPATDRSDVDEAGGQSAWK